MKKIVLTGGGSAGHVTPNIALYEELKKDYKCFYIGSHDGIEKKLIADHDMPYYSISTGKLRRYLSAKNFTDMFRVLRGFSDAKKALKEVSPDVVFSKGGFVAVPVVLAARSLKIPVIIHESDITPGLATKISAKFAKKICVSFKETVEFLPKEKTVFTGTPIRKFLFAGNALKAKNMCNFSDDKPIILAMGGSLGSVKLNTYLQESLEELLNLYNIAHIVGKNNINKAFENTKGYKQFEYLNEELPDLLSLSDIIVSRAGANAISEFLALRKPSLLIPLSKAASRGDQILNAESFKKQGFAKVIFEENLTKDNLISEIMNLYENKAKYIENMKNSRVNDGVSEVIKVIEKEL